MISYTTGFLVTNNYRINEIQIKINGEWANKYDLDYTLGNNGNRSLLDSITKSGRDEFGATVNFTEDAFNYIDTVDNWTEDFSWSLPETFVNIQTGADRGVRLADVNGDGLVDVVRSSETPSSNRVFINNGSELGKRIIQ